MPSTADAAVGDGTDNNTAAAAVRDSAAAAAAVVSSPVSMTSRLSESVSESFQAGASPSSSSSPCSYSVLPTLFKIFNASSFTKKTPYEAR